MMAGDDDANHALLQLARAGFYFEPTPEFPDNVVCYLCLKRVGGWEVTDDPLEEHLRLSNGCGWAIVTAIEAGLGDYGADDPSNVDMMDARKQTFIGRWPHEGKKGWKCKVKQVRLRVRVLARVLASAPALLAANTRFADGRCRLEIHADPRFRRHGNLHLLPACS